METILQHWLLTQYFFPFLFVFAVLYGILVKIKAFGDNSAQLSAIVASVVAFIFISFAYPKLVVSNLILFFSIALTVLFIGMILWGFMSGEAKLPTHKGVLIPIGLLIVVALVIATLWATGFSVGLLDFLFNQSWSQTFWTNFIFIILIAGVMALVLLNKGQ